MSLSESTALKNAPFLLVGQGRRAALLVHGLGGGPYEVQRIAERLHRLHGLTCEGLHLPGHNERQKLMPRSSWEDWYGAVERYYDALNERFDRVDALGFSTGCPLLLNLAQTRGLSGRLVLLAPFVRVAKPALLPFRPEDALFAAERVPMLKRLEQVPGRPPPLKDRAQRAKVEAVQHFKSFNLSAARSALILIRKVMARLDKVKAPTLILQGEKDTVVDPTGAQSIYDGLVCERHLQRFENSDHLLAFDEDREAVIQGVCEFLKPDPAR